MKHRFSISLFAVVLLYIYLPLNISYARDDESVPDLLRELRERRVEKWIEDRWILKLLKPSGNVKKWLHDKAKLEVAIQ
jgi:hypothetical protein